MLQRRHCWMGERAGVGGLGDRASIGGNTQHADLCWLGLERRTQSRGLTLSKAWIELSGVGDA